MGEYPYKAQQMQPGSEEWCVWVGDTYIRQDPGYEWVHQMPLTRVRFRGLARAAIAALEGDGHTTK